VSACFHDATRIIHRSSVIRYGLGRVVPAHHTSNDSITKCMQCNSPACSARSKRAGAAGGHYLAMPGDMAAAGRDLRRLAVDKGEPSAVRSTSEIQQNHKQWENPAQKNAETRFDLYSSISPCPYHRLFPALLVERAGCHPDAASRCRCRRRSRRTRVNPNLQPNWRAARGLQCATRQFPTKCRADALGSRDS
jgi:hypothetical protein